MSSAIEVLATGPLVTVQDMGRPGHTDLGVGVSGAADRGALKLANRLVGNPEDAAGLEVLAGGLALRAHAQQLVAVTGATGPVEVRRRGRRRPAGLRRALVLDEGDELRILTPDRGLRSYLAVRGGLGIAPVLGSRSTDLLAALGPPAVEVGLVIPVDVPPAAVPPRGDGATSAAPTGEEVTATAVRGPRDDWFTDAACRALFMSSWTVTAQSDRVGVRLSGPVLERAEARLGKELPSEGVGRGAVQVPASGQPLIFLADYPVTGGYPVIAVLTDRDVDRVAQMRPGQSLRLRPCRTSLPEK